MSTAPGAASPASQQANVGVIGGMITATLAVLFVPVMKVVRRWHEER